MTDWRVSRRADADLLAIYVYSIREWGRANADSYRQDLYAAFAMIAEFPLTGRDCSDLKRGLRRAARGRHVIFYRSSASGIVISRILHESQDFSRHL